MEQITGPVHGFHLACYTIEAHDGHYAYAKICAVRPETVWEPGIASRKVGVGPFPTEEEAVLAVQEESCRRLALRAAELRHTLRSAPADQAPSSCGTFLAAAPTYLP
jgi:hypothetical protein